MSNLNCFYLVNSNCSIQIIIINWACKNITDMFDTSQ